MTKQRAKPDDTEGDDTDNVVDLEEHLQRADGIEGAVNKLHAFMVDFLRGKVNEYREENPDVVELLSDPIGKDSLAELYDSLMADLDDMDTWDEDDVIEAASIHMLMALSLGGENDES